VDRRNAITRIALFSLAASSRPLRAQAQALQPIRVARPTSEDGTSIYYAMKSGLFQRGGVEVELIPTSSGSVATAAVIAGTYDVAATNPLSVFAAHLRDIPLCIVAPDHLYTPKNPFSLVQIAVDSPYKTGNDLNGKTIAVPGLNDLNTLAARAWVDKNGGDWRSLKFVEIPNSAMAQSVQQHRVDAAILQPPQLDASLADGMTKTLGDGLGAIASSFMLGAYVARLDWAAQHPDLLRTFYRVLVATNNYVNMHQAETAPLVAEYSKIDINSALKMHRSTYATSLQSDIVQPLINAAAKYGHISRTFAARDIIWANALRARG
jgi:NitT/TauT family transport system substrate-binding protein